MEESSDFADLERAARAELKKLTPRARDLVTAIEETEAERSASLQEARRWVDLAWRGPPGRGTSAISVGSS